MPKWLTTPTTVGGQGGTGDAPWEVSKPPSKQEVGINTIHRESNSAAVSKGKN